jgi:hypothetical protein
LALLKQTIPGGYYSNVISKMTISTFTAVLDQTSGVVYYADGSSYANPVAGNLRINLNDTGGFDVFGGTPAQFAAALILHESMHYAYYQQGLTRMPDATLAKEEASIRYWVDQWAVANGVRGRSKCTRGQS